jgi:hypothetical protein
LKRLRRLLESASIAEARQRIPRRLHDLLGANRELAVPRSSS